MTHGASVLTRAAASGELPAGAPGGRAWPSYRTVWRWHFYAGVFCIPFVIFLAITGSIYLFKPQIERWLDRPYDHLVLTGPRASAADQVQAALHAVPGATFDSYELPQASNAAARVLVDRGGQVIRVYVHPQTLAILHTVPEEQRAMKVLFRLHGELLMGNRGSNLVELAACWAIVMILTGLYLWWPRGRRTTGGVLYPRLGRRAGTMPPEGAPAGSTAGRKGSNRLWWRDLHGVAGFWISAGALFLLLTGLPWAQFWGDYFKDVRQFTHTAVARQDWTNGDPSSPLATTPPNAAPDSEHHHMLHMAHRTANVSAVDRVVTAAAALHLPPPVMLAPLSNGTWSIQSQTQNRPQRVNVVVDAATGAVVSRQDFDQRMLIDRIAGTAIAAHEGQLFGPANQLLGLATALGLILVCSSAVVLWWRRRDRGVLGAPPAPVAYPLAFSFFCVLLLLAIYLPLFGASLILILLIERLLLRRISSAAKWLGLATTPA